MQEIKGEVMDTQKLVKEFVRIAKKADELSRIAKPLAQKKRDYMKNLDTDEMSPMEYSEIKKKIRKMDEAAFDEMFKSMNSFGYL